MHHRCHIASGPPVISGHPRVYKLLNMVYFNPKPGQYITNITNHDVGELLPAVGRLSNGFKSLFINKNLLAQE